MTKPATNSTITFNFSSPMTNKDTSHDLITFLTSEPINYSTEITSVLSTTASKSSATTKGTTTEIILHSSDHKI
jgi:hypothetical protein